MTCWPTDKCLVVQRAMAAPTDAHYADTRHNLRCVWLKREGDTPRACGCRKSVRCGLRLGVPHAEAMVAPCRRLTLTQHCVHPWHPLADRDLLRTQILALAALGAGTCRNVLPWPPQPEVPLPRLCQLPVQDGEVVQAQDTG